MLHFCIKTKVENNTQAYNRYSYVGNNPLLPPLGAGGYTDPTGYRLPSPTYETYDPNDGTRGGGGMGGNGGGGETGSYNYYGPYSLYVRNPTLYGYIYGTSSAYWVVSSHSTLVTDPYIGKHYVTDTKKSYNLTTYHVFNASSRGSTSSDRYDYWTDNGDWGMLLAGGGNMTYYTGSSTYKHVPKVYGNTNAYSDYILHGKEGNILGRLWYATKAGWSTLTQQERDDMGDGTQAIAALLPMMPINTAINQTSKIILNNGYYEALGLRMTKYYYNYLWNNGRKAPFLVARELLELTPKCVAPDTIKPGFYKYIYQGWEMVFNPTTKEIWHLQPIK